MSDPAILPLTFMAVGLGVVLLCAILFCSNERPGGRG